MLVAIDVGNTQTVIGIYAGDRLIHHWRMSTKAERTTDEHGAMLGALLRSVGLEPAASRGRRDRVRRCRRSTA